MQALSISLRTVKHLLHTARIAIGTWRRTGLPTAKHEPRGDTAVFSDAHTSMRCGNPARSWRVLSEWIISRGDLPEDYGWLSAHIFNWEDARVIALLTEARVARLLTLRRSADVLKVITQRLAVDPNFRPSSAADTLSVAQIAARSGAPRISRVLLSDFGTRFAGDPRVSVSEALKRRLTQQASFGLRA